MNNHYHSQAILERAQRKYDVDSVDWKVERPTIHNHVFKPSSLKRAWKLVYDKWPSYINKNKNVYQHAYLRMTNDRGFDHRRQSM